MRTEFETTRRELSPHSWHRSLAAAVRDVDELLLLLDLSSEWSEPGRAAAGLFPLLVPHSYLARMERGNPHDPLLRQVLPLGEEVQETTGYVDDPLSEDAARVVPGLLQKYQGRALLITTGACAVHCRYCFRRHYPYGNEPRRLDEWEPALAAIEADGAIREVILSGGDPLMLADERLGVLCRRIDGIPHVRRLRIHTRLPIVLPDRVTDEFSSLLGSLRSAAIVVVHANHPRELVDDCEAALRTLVRGGFPVLNQAVLLRRVNDSADVLAELSERLIELGVMPYYLHQLDRVAGAAHFEVPEQEGRRLVDELRRRLPGYAVPRYVREIAGADYKVPLA